jgi:anti-anti-sigma factor
MLKVHTRYLTNATVFHLQGQIVIGETEILSQALDSISETKAVILDLARVGIVDAHGLGVMLELRERAQTKGIRFKLMNVPRLINRVMEISQLDSVFQTASRVKYFPSVSARNRTSVAPLKSCA